MPTGLVRHHHSGHFHFITCSCFRHKPLLGTPQLRDLFQQILFETTTRYQTQLEAWVIMPNHIHLILTEPKHGTIATVLQVLKQRYTVAMKKVDPTLYHRIEDETAHPPPMPVWETRYYDFNILDPDTYDEKVHYIHQNPVRAGLSSMASTYQWSSHPKQWQRMQGRVEPRAAQLGLRLTTLEVLNALALYVKHLRSRPPLRQVPHRCPV